MGKIKGNVVTKGFSGAFGEDITFRQVDGETFFAKRSQKIVVPSEQQLNVRNKFAEATLYAGTVIENPEVNQNYKVMANLQNLKSSFVAAVADYLTMPELGGVSTAAYKGNVGDIISIASKVQYKIISIDVSILSQDGTVLESGKAVARKSKWLYVATAVNTQVTGSRLVLIAYDRQGKESRLELVL